MMTNLLETALTGIHQELGARLVPFAGYRMPVQYAGVMAEHRAVRERVGLFDVSHMGEVRVEGPGALPALQYVLTNDVLRLSEGQAFYTLMCREDGGIVDDLVVYREGEQSFFICVNASRRAVDIDHMKRNMARWDCLITDVSDEYAQIAVQGPKALPLMHALVGGDELAGLKPFRWVDLPIRGYGPIRIARTGYTGEDGVELYCSNRDARVVWEMLLEVGKPFGVEPCGLGARDTLRLEMKYALYGNDIDENRNPYESGLGWVVKMKKGDFLGRASLAKLREEGPKDRLVGFEMTGRGIPRPGYSVAHDDEVCGVVTSGTFSPSLGRAIGIAYVPVAQSEVGTKLDVVIRGKPVAAVVVETPFYKREK